MKITIFNPEGWEIPIFRKGLQKHKLTFLDQQLTVQNAEKIKNAEAISVFITSAVNEKILRKLPKLKLIATRSTGFDHIDIKVCKKRGVVVCNVPAYSEATVAEHTFALILALTRRIIPSVEQTRRGNFSLQGLRGTDLKEKVLGVVGTGKIGRAVIRMAQGFQMKVIAYDLYPDRKFAGKTGFKYVSLATLLGQADVISLHVPLTRKTRGLINSKNIRKIKRGALLINTARGAIVETHALLTALKAGILSGAALDVLEEECEMKEEAELLTSEFGKRCNLKTLLEQHVLLGMDNVIITPHNAFNSTESVQRLVSTTIENINAFAKGKPMNRVNP